MERVRSLKRFVLPALILAVIALATGAHFFISYRQGSTNTHPPEKITIAHTATTHTVLAGVAEMRGFFKEVGLETTARLHKYGKLAFQDMLGGNAEIALAAETPVALAILRGEKVSIIATIQTSREVNAIVARSDRGINNMSDLKGKKIAATPGTTSDYFLDAKLGLEGISRKDVTIIGMDAERIPDALARGEIDAASLFDPYVILAEKKLGDRGKSFYDKNIYTWTFNVVAKQEFIRKNPGKVEKVLRALVKAEDFVERNPAQAQKSVADFTGLDLAVVKDAWKGADFSVKLDQSLLLALESESEWAIRNGLTGGNKKIPNYLDYIYLDGLSDVKPEGINLLR